MSDERNLKCIDRDQTNKEKLEIAVKDGQKCLRKSPVIVLGSGASIPEGLPSMKELADHLKGSISNGKLSNTDENLWREFIAKLDDTKDLESALQAIELSEKLSNHIVVQTWDLISKADTRVFEKVLGNMNHLPLIKLYEHLFSSTNRTVSVVTTNYDRLAEYAADCASRSRCCHYTGFSYGYLRQQQQPNLRLHFKQGDQRARTVEIWKVHGCLDWFIGQDNQATAVVSARAIPNGWRPAIVTPGIAKYKTTHFEPFRSIIAGADDALENATAYLCVGFGFNDTHIQPKLLERWKQGDAFLVILTKTLSENAKAMLDRANGKKFLALEEARSGGTYMWSHRQQGEIGGVDLWKLSDFLEHTI